MRACVAGDIAPAISAAVSAGLRALLVPAAAPLAFTLEEVLRLPLRVCTGTRAGERSTAIVRVVFELGVAPVPVPPIPDGVRPCRLRLTTADGGGVASTAALTARLAGAGVSSTQANGSWLPGMAGSGACSTLAATDTGSASASASVLRAAGATTSRWIGVIRCSCAAWPEELGLVSALASTRWQARPAELGSEAGLLELGSGLWHRAARSSTAAAAAFAALFSVRAATAGAAPGACERVLRGAAPA